MRGVSGSYGIEISTKPPGTVPLIALTTSAATFLMRGQLVVPITTTAIRRPLVEQYSHSRDFQRLGRMFQHATGLLWSDAGKPLQKVLDRRAIFNVLEQRSYRHASTAKYPSAADAISIALDIRA
jgi:hypothetical protein